MTGLLLPVWKHLPRAASKVYRLQTDDGERIVGRLFHTSDVPGLRAAFNLDGAIALSPNDVFSALIDDGRLHCAAASACACRPSWARNASS